MQLHNGCFINAFSLSGNETLIKLAQKSEPTVGLVIPQLGVPFNPQSKLVDVVYKSSSRSATVQGTKRNVLHTGQATVLTGSWLVVETVANRRALLEFLVSESSNKYDKTRLTRELANFRSQTTGLHDSYPIWVACLSSNGKSYISCHGSLVPTTTTLESIPLGSQNAFDRLAGHLRAKGMTETIINNTIKGMALGAVDTVVESRPTRAAMLEAMSLVGILVAARNQFAGVKSSDALIAEINSVLQPISDKVAAGSGLSSEELTFAFGEFSKLRGHAVDKAHANICGSILNSPLGVLAASTSGSAIENVKFSVAVQVGSWNLTNGSYTVRVDNVGTCTLDSRYNTKVASALAMSKQNVALAASCILDAAAVYGYCVGDGSTWATAMLNDWYGMHGVIGGLAINASN